MSHTPGDRPLIAGEWGAVERTFRSSPAFAPAQGFAHGAPSVGALSIRRFLRPVCFQNVPAELLPDDLGPVSA